MCVPVSKYNIFKGNSPILVTYWLYSKICCYFITKLPNISLTILFTVRLETTVSTAFSKAMLLNYKGLWTVMHIETLWKTKTIKSALKLDFTGKIEKIYLPLQNSLSICEFWHHKIKWWHPWEKKVTITTFSIVTNATIFLQDFISLHFTPNHWKCCHLLC